MQLDTRSFKGTFILLFTALIWGTAFVAQRSAMADIGPFFFSAVRMFLGAITLAVLLLISSRFNAARMAKEACKSAKSTMLDESTKANARHILLGGIACGIVLFLAGNLQQVGLVYTTASKSAFLTAMYIVLVPILGLFIKHKTHWNTWVSVVIAVVGLYLLSVTENLSIEPGDALTIIGAVFWAGHILVVDAAVAKLDSRGVMQLCIVQVLVAGILAAMVSAIYEIGITHMKVSLEALIAAAPALLYVGIMSTGVAYTTQALGQKLAKPATASIVMSMEAVFGALGGVLILGEILTLQEMLGAALLFTAVILTQIEFGRRKGN